MIVTGSIICGAIVAGIALGGCLDETSETQSAEVTERIKFVETSPEPIAPCAMEWAQVESGQFEEDELCDMWTDGDDGDIVVGPYWMAAEHRGADVEIPVEPLTSTIETVEPCATDWADVELGTGAAEDDMCTAWLTHDGVVIVGPMWYADELRETGQIGQ